MRRGSEEAVPGPSVFPSGEPGVSGQCMKVKSESEVAQSCRTLSDLKDCIGSPAQTPCLPWKVLESSHSRQRHGCPPQEPLQSLEGDGHQQASGLHPCPALSTWTHPGLIRELKSSSIVGFCFLPISSAPGVPQTWNSQSRAPHLCPCCPGHLLSLCCPTPTHRPEGTGQRVRGVGNVR